MLTGSTSGRCWKRPRSRKDSSDEAGRGGGTGHKVAEGLYQFDDAQMSGGFPCFGGRPPLPHADCGLLRGFGGPKLKEGGLERIVEAFFLANMQWTWRPAIRTSPARFTSGSVGCRTNGVPAPEPSVWIGMVEVQKLRTIQFVTCARRADAHWQHQRKMLEKAKEQEGFLGRGGTRRRHRAQGGGRPLPVRRCPDVGGVPLLRGAPAFAACRLWTAPGLWRPQAEGGGPGAHCGGVLPCKHAVDLAPRNPDLASPLHLRVRGVQDQWGSGARTLCLDWHGRGAKAEDLLRFLICARGDRACQSALVWLHANLSYSWRSSAGIVRVEALSLWRRVIFTCSRNGLGLRAGSIPPWSAAVSAQELARRTCSWKLDPSLRSTPVRCACVLQLVQSTCAHRASCAEDLGRALAQSNPCRALAEGQTLQISALAHVHARAQVHRACTIEASQS